MRRLNDRQKEMVRSLILHFSVEDIALLVGVSAPTIYRIKQEAVSTMRQVKAQTATLNRLLEER